MSFCVNVSSSSSQLIPLLFCLSQGSVTDPLLFALYTTSLNNLIESASVDHSLFADDTLHIPFFSTTIAITQNPQLPKSFNGCRSTFCVSSLPTQNYNRYTWLSSLQARYQSVSGIPYSFNESTTITNHSPSRALGSSIRLHTGYPFDVWVSLFGSL